MNKPTQTWSDRLFGAKWVLVAITVVLMLSAIWDGMRLLQLANKPFPGFAMDFSFVVSYETAPGWHLAKDKLLTYDRIVAINGQTPGNMPDFLAWIRSQPVGTPIRYTVQRGVQPLHITLPTLFLSTTDILTQYLPLLAVSLLYLLLALFVVVTSPPMHTTLPAIKALLGYLWGISVCASMSPAFDFDPFLGTVLLYFLAMGLFTEKFVRLGLFLTKNLCTTTLWRLLSGVSVILFLGFSWFMVLLTLFLFHHVDPSTTAYHIFDVAFILFYQIFALSFVVFMALMAYGYLAHPIDSYSRKQCRIILTGTMLAFIPFIVAFAIPVHVFKTNPLVPTSVVVLPFLFFPVFVVYAIIRYQAFDIEVIIRKALIYYGLMLVLGSTYLVLAVGLEHLLVGYVPDSRPLAVWVSVLLAWLAYRPTRALIDRLFYRQPYDPVQIAHTFGQHSQHLFDQTELLQSLSKTLGAHLHPAWLTLHLETPAQTWIATAPDYGFVTQAERLLPKHTGNALRQVPIPFREQCLGTLYLGPRLSELPYDETAEQLIANLLGQLALRLNTLTLLHESIQLRVATQALANKAAFIEQITAHLTHDLKSPLVSCHNLVNLLLLKLKRGQPMAELKLPHTFERLNHSFSRLSEYIQLSLDREILEQGHLKLQQEGIGVQDIFEQVLLLHSDYQQARHICIQTDFSNEALFILGDRLRFERVLSNLLSNALKHATSVVHCHIQAQPHQVQIQVQDDGHGLQTELRQRLNSAQESLETVGSAINQPAMMSSGLGLAICKAYVDLMGGTLTCQSQENQGTTFTLTFPQLETLPASRATERIRFSH